MDEFLDDIDSDDLLLSDEGDESSQMYEHFRFVADKGQTLLRVDKFLVDRIMNATRNRIQLAAEAGCILVNGKPVKSNYRVKPLDVVSIVMDRPKREIEIIPEEIPLNIVYEDEDLLVVNKPAGLVVHPGHGNYTGTLLNALAWYLRDDPQYDPSDPRLGLVHRIDKDTSGLIIAAKNDFAHAALAAQLKDHSLARTYVCIVCGNVKDDSGTIDAPIGRHPADRKKMAVTEKNSRSAVTHWRVLERFSGYTLVECRLETGRTHQIRVHFSENGHPLLGDKLYGGERTLIARQALHAGKLGFTDPFTKKYLEFSCPIPPDMQLIIDKEFRN